MGAQSCLHLLQCWHHDVVWFVFDKRSCDFFDTAACSPLGNSTTKTQDPLEHPAAVVIQGNA